MFTMTSDALAYARALEKMEKTALPKVTARTLNAISGGAMIQQGVNLRSSMIIRSKYTEKSLRHYKASETKPVARQNAVVGSVSPYLPIQNDGGKIRAKNKKIAIPTNKIRGADRKKKIPARYRISSMQPIGKTKFFVLYPTKSDPGKIDSFGLGGVRKNGKRKIIYGRKRGGKTVAYRLKNPAIFIRTGKKKIVKLRDLSLSSYNVKANRWHTSAIFQFAKRQTVSNAFIKEAKQVFGDFAAAKVYRGIRR